MRVTRNLAMELTYIQTSIANSPLWVDALCIDQDNILERNYQVREMHAIYRNVSRVHTWIGRPVHPSMSFRFLN